jgi:hypothetical protein
MPHDDSILSDAELEGVVGGASTAISATTFHSIWTGNPMQRKAAVGSAGVWATANGLAGGANEVKFMVDKGLLSVTQITQSIAGKTVTSYDFTRQATGPAGPVGSSL